MENETRDQEWSNDQDMHKTMERAMEMMRMFNAMNENDRRVNAKGCPCEMKDGQVPPCRAAQPGHHGARTRPPLPSFYDEQISTPELRCVKAAIPFLEARYQRGVGVMVKLVEIQKLLEAYEQPGLMQGAYGKDWRRGMLLAVRAHMPMDKQRRIDLILNALNMKDMIESMEMEGVGRER